MPPPPPRPPQPLTHKYVLKNNYVQEQILSFTLRMQKQWEKAETPDD